MIAALSGRSKTLALLALGSPKKKAAQASIHIDPLKQKLVVMIYTGPSKKTEIPQNFHSSLFNLRSFLLRNSTLIKEEFSLIKAFFFGQFLLLF